ncbi:MAG: PepSY domain-containing protein, partial [Aquincola sp.]|nr:PepSY domain-containing protein [Aquincola sp.]
MTSSALRTWTWLHKWTSLVCTVFMLLLCITGLPLIFSHEIEHWQYAEIQPDTVAPGTIDAPLDRVLASAQARHPTLVAQYLSRDADEPQMWLATLGP